MASDSELKKFVSKYDTNRNQTMLFNSICDELLYPIFTNENDPASKAQLKLICSESSEHHMLRISFPDINNDPLGDFYIDKYNYMLLEHHAAVLLSKFNGNSWEVSIQM